MLKQTITYTDFNGTQRTEDLYFNLTEFELVELQVDSERGIQADLQDAINDKDLRRLLDFIKTLVHKSYGIKSEDGRHFDKSPEITARFVNSALYSDLLLHLFEEEGARAEKFITGLMPKELLARAIAQSQGQTGVPAGYKPDARTLAEQRRQEARIPEATVEGNFNEGVPIGGAPQVSFQAPATLPEQFQPATPPHQQVVQPDPATVPARVESPILPGGYTETSSAPEDNRPFRIKETPLDEKQTQDDPDLAAFKEWKAQQGKHSAE